MKIKGSDHVTRSTRREGGTKRDTVPLFGNTHTLVNVWSLHSRAQRVQRRVHSAKSRHDRAQWRHGVVLGDSAAAGRYSLQRSVSSGLSGLAAGLGAGRYSLQAQLRV